MGLGEFPGVGLLTGGVFRAFEVVCGLFGFGFVVSGDLVFGDFCGCRFWVLHDVGWVWVCGLG